MLEMLLLQLQITFSVTKKTETCNNFVKYFVFQNAKDKMRYGHKVAFLKSHLEYSAEKLDVGEKKGDLLYQNIRVMKGSNQVNRTAT